MGDSLATTRHDTTHRSIGHMAVVISAYCCRDPLAGKQKAMHRLKVEGFLGIEYADIVVDGLTVLIGAQASGKSVIARLVYFFNEYFADFDIVAVSNNESKKAYDRRKESEFCGIFPPYSWRKSEFTIVYSNNDHEVTVRSSEYSYSIDIKTSSSVANYFRRLNRAYRKFMITEEEDESVLYTRYAFRKQFVITELMQYESALFVPSARSFYATMRDKIFSIFAADEKLDRIILKFGEFYEGAKAGFFRNSTDARFKRILKGEFVPQEDNDWIFTDHGRTELSKSSSGQQEAVPLLVAISQFPKKGRTLIIEEPEAHLFPEAQVDVLDFIVCQLERHGCSIMFTTHSPYLLSSLNNRILAHERGFENGISIDKVRAYLIEGGVTKSLVDEEFGLISAEYIDSVSERIADEFDRYIEGE